MRAGKIKILLIFLFGILFFPVFSLADSLGQAQIFFVDPDYSLNKSEQVSATLQKISSNSYFYLENSWYQNLEESEKKVIDQKLEALSQEFDKIIYPRLTSSYGKEWSPGIDGDYRITILFHQTNSDSVGYFNNGDEYSKLQNPKSNQREMIYLSSQELFSSNIKIYLAHEFVHLITFNQKDRLVGVAEDVWLNESRAEYAPTLLGYDNEYEGSNLQQRVRSFIQAPSDSLTEWQGQKNDYGVINVFAQYLVDQYGVEILTDSMRSLSAGISSINDFLKKQDYKRDFSQVFTDWTIAIYANNCNLGQRYCYKNTNLKNLKISPSLIFFPSTYKTKFSLDYSISQWSGNWYRVVGGGGKLDIVFKGNPMVKFSIPYILCQDSINCSINFLSLDTIQNGAFSIDNFGKDWTSLILIPSIQSKFSNFSDQEPKFSFSISAEMTQKPQDEKLIQELTVKITELQNKIAQIQAQIDAILGKITICGKFEKDLYFGMTNSQEVRCLQEFLKKQGIDIYPEGLITGNFFSATKSAVIKYQEKKGIVQTGYFGSLSRKAANNQ